MYIYLQRPLQFTPHSCLTVRIPSARSALSCVSFTLSCVSVCFPNIHITRHCDLRRHAYCAVRFPSITGLPRRRDVVAVAVAPTGDGLSLVPWQNGKALCWDVTVICPLADSYISAAARDAGAAAELAASPQRSEIRGVRLSLYVCSHCLRELGSTKCFSSPAPFWPWPKIDWHFGRKPGNQLPVSEMFSLGTAL